MSYCSRFGYVNSSYPRRSINFDVSELWIIKFGFDGRTQWQMFLLQPPCWCPSRWAPTWGLHTNSYKFGWNTFPNNAQMNCRTDLNILARLFTTRWPTQRTPSRRRKEWQGRIKTSRYRHFNLQNHSKQHMASCGFSLHLGSSESRKTLEQKFIFQIGTLNRTLFILLIYSCFCRHCVPTNSVAPLSPYKPTHNPQFLHSLWRRANARNVSFITRYGGQFSWYPGVI